MDLSHIYKGSLIKVIGDLCKLVPKGINRGCVFDVKSSSMLW